jgi:hypothetical protein
VLRKDQRRWAHATSICDVRKGLSDRRPDGQALSRGKQGDSGRREQPKTGANGLSAYSMRKINVKSCAFQVATLVYLLTLVPTYRSTRWSSLLRHCASSRKVAGLIPLRVTRIFH